MIADKLSELSMYRLDNLENLVRNLLVTEYDRKVYKLEQDEDTGLHYLIVSESDMFQEEGYYYLEYFLSLLFTELLNRE